MFPLIYFLGKSALFTCVISQGVPKLSHFLVLFYHPLNGVLMTALTLSKHIVHLGFVCWVESYDAARGSCCRERGTPLADQVSVL